MKLVLLKIITKLLAHTILWCIYIEGKGRFFRLTSSRLKNQRSFGDNH